MKNKVIKQYYNQSNKVFGSILMIGLMILLVGFSYAFFVYNKTGLYTHTITGGKMSIIYNETTGNNITIANAYPLTDVESITKALEFEFTISGYNESDKNIYYAIEMDYGEDVSDKERFLDTDIKLSLYENDEEIFANEIFNNLDNQDIYYGMINQGTSSESSVTNNYKLRIWINDFVVISDTLSNDLSTWTDFEWNFLEDYNPRLYDEIMWSDNQYLSDYGISIYTTEEFQNRYANFKVNVKADLTYDDVGFITYDANGGEFTPEKTSLTTGRVTKQKPVMRTEVTATSNNSKGKITQIENEVDYVYKGFIGWSSTPDGEVEYRAGDYFTEQGKVLYAVYDDTFNVMGDLSSFNDYKRDIREIHFINDTLNSLNERYEQSDVKVNLTHESFIDNGIVLGWLEQNENDNTILYIGSEGTTYLGVGSRLFEGFSSTYLFELSNVDTSMITDMSSMFATNKNLPMPISNNKLEDNANNLLFDGYSNSLVLAETSYSTEYSILDLSMFNTSNVINMSYMFNEYGYSPSINLSSFDTSKVEYIYSMFRMCQDLKKLELGNFNTSKIEDMSRMFVDCASLESLDVSNFDTSNVTSMDGMFNGCKSLKYLNISNFDTSMIEQGNGLSFDYSNVDELYMNNSIIVGDVVFFNQCQIKNLSVDNSVLKGDFSKKFYGCSSLEYISFNNVDTSNMTNMSYMFYGCENLVELNLDSFDTRRVTNMKRMFGDCSGLMNLDVSNFDTSNVVSMEGMFAFCYSLTSIHLTNFDVSQVFDIGMMFYDCINLQRIYCNNNWNNSIVSDSYNMFYNCASLIGGVSFTPSNTDIFMANPDTGYFTRKNA